MKVTARFRVCISGWVTVTREVESFDRSKTDHLHSNENEILDEMADDAISSAGDYLDGEVDGTEVLEVTP